VVVVVVVVVLEGLAPGAALEELPEACWSC